MRAAAGPRPAGLLGSGLFALAVLAVLIGLGTWQIERKTWKEGLIEALAQRLSAEPIPIPLPERWAGLDRARDEFRRVTFSATFAPDDEGLVYATASALRNDVAGLGYWVFAPVRLAGNAAVVVNRGFVPEGKQAPASHPARAGVVTMTGVLRWPEARGWFLPNDDPARNLWFARDHVAMAAAKGWSAVAPFYVELETSTSDTDLPHASRLVASLPNNHLQYAITWYALAIVLAIVFAFWLKSRRAPGA